MRNKERDDLKKKVTDRGGKNSAYSPNIQFIKGEKVTHIGENRTKIGSKTYYGSSAANEALDDL